MFDRCELAGVNNLIDCPLYPFKIVCRLLSPARLNQFPLTQIVGLASYDPTLSQYYYLHAAGFQLRLFEDNSSPITRHPGLTIGPERFSAYLPALALPTI